MSQYIPISLLKRVKSNMRRIYDTDLKDNNATTVTELTLTKKGVVRNQYVTEYTTGNNIKLVSNTDSDPLESVSNSLKQLASATADAHDSISNLSNYKIACDDTKASSNFPIPAAMLIANIAFINDIEYTPGSKITFILHNGNTTTTLCEMPISVSEDITDVRAVNLNKVITPVDDNAYIEPIMIGNENTEAVGIIVFEFYKNGT